MAQVTNTYESYDAVGNREELADKIWQITPEETPFLSLIGRKNVVSTHPEWQVDELGAQLLHAGTTDLLQQDVALVALDVAGREVHGAPRSGVEERVLPGALRYTQADGARLGSVPAPRSAIRASPKCRVKGSARVRRVPGREMMAIGTRPVMTCQSFQR